MKFSGIGKEGDGVGNNVRRKPESNPSRGLNCSFANVSPVVCQLVRVGIAGEPSLIRTGRRRTNNFLFELSECDENLLNTNFV